MKRSDLPKLMTPAVNARFGFEIPDNIMARWQPGIHAKDDAESDNTISMYDPIGETWLGDGVTAKRISAALRSIGDGDVIVNLNSPGGDVFEGIAIYNLLREHKGSVTVRVMGLAASAASVIAMAGDNIEVSRAGFFMIHNVWMVAVGNRNDLRDAADTLDPIDRALADVYAARTGMDAKTIAKMMDKETWIGGSDAVDQGFADGLLPADKVEESTESEGKSNALRRIDVALAKQGMTRADRRALLSALSGTPRAAGQTTPSAGAASLIDFCESITTKLS